MVLDSPPSFAQVLRVLFEKFGHLHSFLSVLSDVLSHFPREILLELPLAALWPCLLAACTEDAMLFLVTKGIISEGDIDSIAAATSASKPFIQVAWELKRSGIRLSPSAATTWLPPILHWCHSPELLKWMWWQAARVQDSPRPPRDHLVALYDECIHAILLYQSSNAPSALLMLNNLAQEMGVPVWDPAKYAQLLVSDDWWTSRPDGMHQQRGRYCSQEPEFPLGRSPLDERGYTMRWILTAAGSAAGDEVILTALQRALDDTSIQAAGTAAVLGLALPPGSKHEEQQVASLKAALKQLHLRGAAALIKHLGGSPSVIIDDSDFYTIDRIGRVPRYLDVDLRILLDSMSARPGPLADKALKLASKRLHEDEYKHLFGRDTYSLEARSEVFRSIAYGSFGRSSYDEEAVSVLLKLVPLVSAETRAEVILFMTQKGGKFWSSVRVQDDVFSLLLELVPSASESAYNTILWNFLDVPNVYAAPLGLVKTLLERRGATTVLLRLAEAARTDQKYLESLRVILEGRWSTLASDDDDTTARILMCVGSYHSLARWLAERASDASIKDALKLAAVHDAPEAVEFICRYFANNLDAEALRSAYAAKTGSSIVMIQAFQAAANTLGVKLQ